MLSKFSAVVAVVLTIGMVGSVADAYAPLFPTLTDSRALKTHLQSQQHTNEDKAAKNSITKEQEFRNLMQQQQQRQMEIETCTQSFILGNCAGEDLVFTGSCGGLFEKKDTWCVDGILGYDVCCGEDAGDCCEPSSAGLAVFIIVPLVAVSLIVLASCACCACCPFHSKLCCASSARGNAEPRAPATSSVSKPQPHSTTPASVYNTNNKDASSGFAEA